MKLLFFDQTEKINRIPEELLKKAGKTREQLLKTQEKENAALLLCGAQLGSVYVLAEMIDSYLVDVIPKLKKNKWYKFTIKKGYNTASELTSKYIESVMNNSLSDKQDMMDLADNLNDKSKFDLFKLKNSIYLELSKRKYWDSDLLADLILVHYLYSWTIHTYDKVIRNMNKIYPAFYETWFNINELKKAADNWVLATNELLRQKGIDDGVDLTKVNSVNWGTTKLENNFSPENIEESANEVNFKTDSSKPLILEAIKILGIEDKIKINET